MNHIKFTNRAIELFNYADKIRNDYSSKAIHPIHLFLAAFRMNYNTNQELKKLVKLDEAFMFNISKVFTKQNFEEHCYKLELNREQCFNIFESTKLIVNEAQRLTQMYEEHGQIYLSDGQILRVLMSIDDMILNDCFENIDRDLVISIVSPPRDMIVDLSKEIDFVCQPDVVIRKASCHDEELIIGFVEKYFYDRWANTIKIGFETKDVPIYIAIVEDEIVGFAGYNISKRRKGYFGPLGVLKTHRDKKIGQALVISCMNELKNQGFDYCIIGNASSFDFYEKACGAKTVQLNKEL